MAIEIYDKAKIVKKDGMYYYLLKHGSKNTFTSPYQTVIDDNLNNKFLRGESRSSDWRVIAYGTEKAHIARSIANTSWNAPTGAIYGEIRFGDKLNIALWYAKNIFKTVHYETLTDRQKANFDDILSWHETQKLDYENNGRHSAWCINLDDVDKEQKMKEVYEGGYVLRQHEIIYDDRPYWQLDNL